MPKPAAPSKEAINDELGAMRRIVNALEGLDTAAQRRVLCWTIDRFDYPIGDDIPLTPLTPLGDPIAYTPSIRD